MFLIFISLCLPLQFLLKIHNDLKRHAKQKFPKVHPFLKRGTNKTMNRSMIPGVQTSAGLFCKYMIFL